MKIRMLPIAAVLALLSACGREEPAPAPADDTAKPAQQAPAATPSSPPPAETAPSRPIGFGPHRPSDATRTVSTAPLGVAACDDFLAKYEACIAKAPEEARPGMQTALASWRGAWRPLASTPTTHGNLERNCQAAADSVRSQLASYGCE